MGRFEVLRGRPRVLGLFRHQVESSGLDRAPPAVPGYLNSRYQASESLFEGEAAGVGWSREEQARQAVLAERSSHWEELIERRRAADEEQRERLVEAQQLRMVEDALVKRRASIEVEKTHEAEAAMRRERALEQLAQEGNPSTLHRLKSVLNSEMGRDKGQEDQT